MLSDDLVLSYSSIEIFALASLLGGELLVGIPDPFPGWLAEEISSVMQTTLRSLAERGHLSILDDGRVLVDVVAAALVSAVASPQVVILLTRTSPGQPPLQLGFYTRSPLTVLVESDERGWLLRPVSSAYGIMEHIRSAWEIESQRAVCASVFTLPEEALDLARRAIPQGVQSVQECLRKSGVSATEANALAQTLISPRRNGALVAIDRRETAWNVDGLGMLEGENGMWLLRTVPHQQSRWIEVSPCSANRLAEEIERLLSCFVVKQ